MRRARPAGPPGRPPPGLGKLFLAPDRPVSAFIRLRKVRAAAPDREAARAAGTDGTAG
jgi:hypothetical protein